MKYVAITPTSQFRRLSLLAPRYFEVKLENLFDIYHLTKEEIKEFTKNTSGLKGKSIINFYSVISAFEASKILSSLFIDENFLIFKNILKNKNNPYICQYLGKKYIEYEQNFELDVLIYLTELSLAEEDKLRVLLNLIKMKSIKDLTISDNQDIYEHISIDDEYLYSIYNHKNINEFLEKKKKEYPDIFEKFYRLNHCP